MRAVVFVLAVLLLAPLAHAAGSGEVLPAGTLPEVVVTATSIPQPTKEVPVHVQVVTSQQIREADAKDMSDVLARYVPGHFHKYGVDYSSVGIRGFRSNSMVGTDLKSRTLILIDGMRAGTGRISNLPVDNVDRIEVVRGPGSVVYGGSAMGGVINIITRRGTGEAKGSVTAEVGSSDQYKVMGEASGAVKEDAVGYAIGGHVEGQGDYVTGGGKTIDNSQMKNKGLSGSLTYRKGGRDSFNAVGIVNKAESGSPGSGAFPSSTDKSSTLYQRASLDWTTTREGGAAGWYGRAYAVKSAYDWNDGETEIDTISGGLRAGLDFETGSFGNLILGVEYDRIKENQRETVWGPNTRYNNYAVHAEQRVTAGDFIFYLGGRYDDYNMKMADTSSITVSAESRKFTQLSWRGGAVYDATEWLAFRTAVGTGFRAPSAEELAGSYTTNWGATYTGNSDLKAETAITAEIGSDFYLDCMTAGMTLFHTRSKDTITTTGTFPSYTYKNIKGLDLTALEGYLRSSYEMKYKDTKLVFQPYLNGIYYLNRKNRDESLQNTRGTELPLYISEMTLTAGLTAHIGPRFTYDLNMVYVGKQKIESFRTAPSTYTTMDPYTVVGTRLTFRPMERLSTYVDVQNLFDRKYDCVDDYTMPGRSMKLGASYSF